MLTINEKRGLTALPNKPLKVYFDYHLLLTLSLINLICKLIVFAGLITTIFSNHWARSPRESNVYAGYKARCTVHICLSNNPDPTWMIDFIAILAVINLLMELINTCIIGFFRMKINRIDLVLGFMFIITFIITDCGIVFAIHIGSYVYQSPMGYAFYYFITCMVFSIADWGFSLKRFISDWPEIICLTKDEHKRVSDNGFPTIPEQELSIVSSPLVISNGLNA